MANQWGYAVLNTDRPGTWFADGYVGITDGYGTPDFSAVPSGIVKSVTYTATGKYSIVLDQAWYKLVSATFETVLPSGSSPACLTAQIESSTVGDSSVLPISAGGVGQKVVFKVYNPATGTATDLPSGSGFFFSLILQQTKDS